MSELLAEVEEKLQSPAPTPKPQTGFETQVPVAASIIEQGSDIGLQNLNQDDIKELMSKKPKDHVQEYDDYNAQLDENIASNIEAEETVSLEEAQELVLKGEEDIVPDALKDATDAKLLSSAIRETHLATPETPPLNPEAMNALKTAMPSQDMEHAPAATVSMSAGA